METIRWFIIVVGQCGLCLFFASRFYKNDAVYNDAFWLTLVVAGIFGYEAHRLFSQVYYQVQYPITKERLLWYRIAHGLIAIYYWEAYHYVKQKIKQKQKLHALYNP